MALVEALEARVGATVERLSPLYKSSFGPTYRAELSDGRALFVKSSDAPTERFFAEADGLSAIASTGAIRTPKVIEVGDCFLALEYIESAPPRRGYARRFGEKLAALHRVSAERFGHHRDNFIGALPQSNRLHDSFIDFYRCERLIPMRERTADALGEEGSALLDRLIDELGSHLEMNEPPSLIHGDLWNGNVMSDGEGKPVIFDPAVAYADRELDLAMLELFGGLGSEFYRAYDATYPRRPGWKQRQPIYQLYYLLVHVALFGGSYIQSTKRALRSILAR